MTEQEIKDYLMGYINEEMSMLHEEEMSMLHEEEMNGFDHILSKTKLFLPICNKIFFLFVIYIESNGIAVKIT